MKGSEILKASISIAAMGAALALPVQAMAQTATGADDEPADQAEIVVTGTSIRGEAPVGSSLIQLGRSEIEATPAGTATQIVREVPQIFNFGVNDSARNQSGGAGNIVYGNSINIRGIGPYATLTLINGRRPVPQGTLGASVDPGNIPAIALERVEVIADGASAIYGSDAVAGVANLILRRRYEGVGVDVQHGWGDDYKEFTANAIIGHDWGSGRFTLAGQHSYRSALAGTSRDFYQSDLTARGGADYRVDLCNTGNIVIGSTNYAIPASGATSANLVAGTKNLCDNIKSATDILPQQETNSATLTFDQDITDSIHFFADALYSKRSGFRRSTVAEATLSVPTTNAFFVAPAGAVLSNCTSSAGVPAGTKCENVKLSFAGIYGSNSTSSITSEVWQVTAGLDFRISDKWNATTYFTYGKDHDHVFSVGNGTDATALAAALRSNDPATALNPFGTSGGNSAATLAAVFDRLTDTDGRTEFIDAGIKVDGSLLSLPGGDVKLAVGGEINGIKLRTGQIVGRAGAQTGTDNKLKRDITSAYAELLIPIFGPDNAIPGFHSLDIDLAGRIDRYSDVGATKNPKVGITWQPIEDLKIHGSYGESFRAPLLTQLTSAGGSRLFVQSYFDPTVNAAVDGVALSGGNLGLQPETARTWSVGFDYTPSALPGAQLSVNYFDLVYKGQVASYLSDLNLLRRESLFGSIILRGAAAQSRVSDFLAQGLTMGRGTSTQALASLVFVDGRTNNLGTTIAKGIDFGLVVPVEAGSVGRLKFSLRGQRFFTYKIAFTPGGTITDQLNNIDNSIKFRARAGVSLDNGPFSFNVYANHTNAYNNTYSTLAPKVDANTTVDLAMSYDFGDILPIAKKFRLGLNVVNLFDKDPPFVDVGPTNNGGGGFDPANASPLGRVVSVSLRSSF